jgi:signal transduction histidine kinase
MIYISFDSLAMLVTILVSFFMVIYAWRFRQERALLPFLWAIGSAGVWALNVLLEMSIPNVGWKYFLAMSKPFAVLGMVSAFTIIAIDQAIGREAVGLKHVHALLVVPLITLFLSFCPEWGHFYRYDFKLRPHGATYLTTWTGGPWQQVFHLYVYLLAFISLALIFYSALRTQQRYRRVMLFVAASWSVSFIADLCSKFGLLPQESNPIAYGLCFATLVSAWGFLSEKILELGPIARTLVVDGMEDLLFVFDPQDRMVDCNRNAGAVLGLGGQSWMGRSPAEMSDPWPGIVAKTVESEQSGVKGNAIISLNTKIYEVRDTPLLTDRGLNLGRMVLLHDITDLESVRAQLDRRNRDLEQANQKLVREMEQREQTERQLSQAAHMEAVGRLAGGVAHDFNNLLTVISGYSDLSLDQLKPSNPIYPFLDGIRKAGERAAALTHQLLAFSRRQVIEPRAVDLNQLINGSWEMLRRLVAEDVELVKILDPGTGNVMADPGQLHQVLMNLAANARDAMPSGGRLTVETRMLEVEKALDDPKLDLNPGTYVSLVISDTGCGMDEETRLHAFEPFFTTKASGKGTGLGLSTVYGVVKQCGGGERSDF